MFEPKPRPMAWRGSAPFPCHPRKTAYLLGADVTAERVTFWEQECPNPMCGSRFRFRRDGMWLWVTEFTAPFTEPVPAQQTSPAPKFEVAWRLAQEALEESA